MASEEESELIGTLRGESLPTILHSGPAHDPAPPMELVDDPSGDGKLGLVKVGEDTWRVERFAGARDNVVRHRFDSLSGFAAWLSRSATEPGLVQVFASLPSIEDEILEGAVSPSVTARLDPRDPDGDRVVCRVRYAPEFEAWVRQTRNRRLGQRELFRLVRGYGEAVSDVNGAESLAGTLSALRVAGDSSLELEIAPNGRTRVSGVRGEVKVSKELPAEIELGIPIYQGVMDEHGDLSVYRIRVMLDVEALPGHGIAVELVLPDLARTLQSAGADLVSHLQRELGDGWLVCAGQEEGAAVASRTRTGMIAS